MRALLAAATAMLAVGCGGSGDSDGSALVDPDRPPLINSLEQAPSADALLLTTNTGLYRIEDGEATQVRSHVDTPDGRSPVGRFLALAQSEDGALLGSGHPDEKGAVAGFLGLLRSEDEGRSWEVVSRYALADLHTIRSRDGTLFAHDAVLPALIVSQDGGKTWDERSAPPGRVIDFVVDPSDTDLMLASGVQTLFRSTDGGQSWTSATGAAGPSLEWPEPDALYRADEDGRFYVSRDGAATWEMIGLIDGEPRAMQAVGPEELYVALDDATIVYSTDGGESWEETFTP